MADDEHKKEGGGPMQMLWTVLICMGILVFLWFYTGAYKNADLTGVFLAPPAPLGPGGAYGPQVGTTSDFYNNNQQ